MKIQWIVKQEITRNEGDRHFYIKEEMGTLRLYWLPSWGRKIGLGKTDAKGVHYYIELYLFGVMYSQTVLFTKDSEYQFDTHFDLRQAVSNFRQMVLNKFRK